MASIQEIHRDVMGAWNARDFAKMRALLHAEYTYTGPDGQVRIGPEAGMAIAQMYATAFPDGQLDLQQVHVAGNTSICEMVARGTHGGDLMGIAATGKKVEIRICNVMEVRDGLVHREREYMDLLTMMTQLGVVKV